MALHQGWLGSEDVERIVVSDETFGKRVKSQMQAKASKGGTRVQERHQEQEGLSLDPK